MPKPIDIIVCVDADNGIGPITWKNAEDLAHFKKTTENSTVIMGRKTYEAIPPRFRPLKGRFNIVISTSAQCLGDITCKSFDEAIDMAQKHHRENIYICGGSSVYKEALMHPLFRYLYITRLNESYNCSIFFPDNISAKHMAEFKHPREIKGGKIEYLENCRANHLGERDYLALLRTLCDHGFRRPNRTGIDTFSMFGQSIRYKLADNFGRGILPLLTTKYVPYRLVLEELFWFIRGATNAKELQAKNVHIWDDNSSREFLDNRGLTNYPEGELGPIYGSQWRNWNGEGIDQLSDVIEGLKKDPFGRRHMVIAWNPSKNSKMALPPCHYSFIFMCRELGGGQYGLICHVIMRSCDMFLGHPFNAASYGTLAHMVAKLLPGAVAEELIITMSDCHIYSSHLEQVKEQIAREFYEFPQIKIRGDQQKIDDFKPEDIEILQYFHWPKIPAKMAV